MRLLLLAALLILPACGSGEEEDGGSLNIEDRALADRIEDLAVLEKNEAAAAPKPALPIEPLSYDEIARELRPGAGCDLFVGDQLLLVAVTNDAIVKSDGRILHLKGQGHPTQTGGYFTGEGLSISIGRAGPDGQRSGETMSWPAEASIRHASEEKPQTIKAIWRCGA